jgi:membrane fusion protein, multidrug efflux system
MNAWLRPILILFAVASLSACSRKEPAPEPIRAVRTMTVGSAATGGVHEYAAEVKARTEVRLSFRVAGKVANRTVEVGQRVRAGQLLAQLDPVDLKLGQDSANAALRAAQASHELAQAEFKRYKDLRDQGFISAVELERRETTLLAQRALWDQARAQANVQGNMASYAQLLAPAAGLVTGVDAEAGSVVATGASVVRLAVDGPRDAVFSVPEDTVLGLRALQGKPGALRARAWGASAETPLTVREVGAAADPATRTFLVKADMGSNTLQLGQTVTVLIDLPRRDAAARLPLTAVMQQQGQTAVWVLDKASMSVKVQPVTVAGADGNAVIIANGLSPGQTVVTAGVHLLSPGQKVKLFEAAPPPAGIGQAAPASAAASR